MFCRRPRKFCSMVLACWLNCQSISFLSGTQRSAAFDGVEAVYQPPAQLGFVPMPHATMTGMREAYTAGKRSLLKAYRLLGTAAAR